MIVAERLRPDDPVEVCFHQFLDEVYFFKVLEGRRAENVEDGDDVLVVKVPEQPDLSEGAQTKHGVVKGGDTLDGDLSLRGEVHRRAWQWEDE